MKQTFYSNGKLLITGEYIVLDDAKAFALPTKFGQNLIVENGIGKKITWKSFDKDESVWFEDVLLFEEIINGSKKEEADSIKKTLVGILHEAYLLNPKFIDNSDGYKIITELTFPKFWGLGTSSTLINNVAQWIKIDAFDLLNNSFGGSGYDIACAQNDTPIVYHLENGKPAVEQIEFDPSFKENLYFVYLNKKQSSKAAIASYYAKQNNLSKSISALEKITQNVIQATDLRTFASELEKHEIIMSDILEMQTVKERFFPDFNGVVKSLGAWGGDFVLVVSKDNPTSYFEKREFKTILPYSEMIL
ncbi:mevalonate kinase [Flavobacterium arsenatis]|uniref:Mevalonate kinase n=1 Tax=Flavobacterium arsenatis TaxID=1484332 RepID=A0ABU1TLS0_9FLAO|nr:GYDIA family GHMP kinase [Flavobacterium arsenatis]MDR6966915.1 mevalonate kinase [Flavobacterium arsenatis]